MAKSKNIRKAALKAPQNTTRKAKTPHTHSLKPARSLRGPLQELGLSYGAEQAYMKLMEGGPKLMADIARQSGQFRADTYRHTDELLRHDLIHIVRKGKRKYYEAASPESIFSILKTKEDRIAVQVTELLTVFDRQQKGFSMETFSGKKGLEAAYEILLKDAKKGAELLRIESPRDYQRNKKYYPKIYWDRAGGLRGDLQKVVITNTFTCSSRRKSINRTSKPVPERYSPFNFDYTTAILGDRVAYIDSELEKAFVLKDARFANYMRAIFWMLYERL